MSCDKKAYASPASAKRALRSWRKLARRSNFDRAHVYPADCREHKGKFHIGRTHDPQQGLRKAKIVATRKHAQMRAEVLDSLDDVFNKQVQRIAGTLSKSERRMQQCLDPVDGPLVMAETTLCRAGDRIDVEDRK